MCRQTSGPFSTGVTSLLRAIFSPHGEHCELLGHFSPSEKTLIYYGTWIGSLPKHLKKPPRDAKAAGAGPTLCETLVCSQGVELHLAWMILEDLELVWQECNLGDTGRICASISRKQGIVSLSAQGHSPVAGERLKEKKTNTNPR